MGHEGPQPATQGTEDDDTLGPCPKVHHFPGPPVHQLQRAHVNATAVHRLEQRVRGPRPQGHDDYSTYLTLAPNNSPQSLTPHQQEYPFPCSPRPFVSFRKAASAHPSLPSALIAAVVNLAGYIDFLPRKTPRMHCPLENRTQAARNPYAEPPAPEPPAPNHLAPPPAPPNHLTLPNDLTLPSALQNHLALPNDLTLPSALQNHLALPSALPMRTRDGHPSPPQPESAVEPRHLHAPQQCQGDADRNVQPVPTDASERGLTRRGVHSVAPPRSRIRSAPGLARARIRAVFSAPPHIGARGKVHVPIGFGRFGARRRCAVRRLVRRLSLCFPGSTGSGSTSVGPSFRDWRPTCVGRPLLRRLGGGRGREADVRHRRLPRPDRSAASVAPERFDREPDLLAHRPGRHRQLCPVRIPGASTHVRQATAP